MNKSGGYLALVTLLISIGGAGCANQAVVGSSSEPPALGRVAQSTPFDYRDYAAVLKTYVNQDGLVDYSGLKANRKSLDRFNTALGNVNPATYKAWSASDRLAFLINAYNSITLASIIDNYPVKSIRDISGVWKGRKFRVVSQEVTLDNIEHNTIRKQFSEPRIHFAVNCASIGCPILLNEPYTGDKLNQQLDKQVRVSLASQHHFRVDRTNNRLYLSSVFKWFGEDWEKTHAQPQTIQGLNHRETALIHFIRQYVSPADQTFLQQGGYQISYIDWDWALNSQRPQKAES
jgi:Protein of unknown function, DUF547